MPNVETITANWETGNLTNRVISRQYDNNRYRVQFAGYPEDGAENLLFYLLVFMKTDDNPQGTMIAPVQLSSDQWTISNYFTQLEQQIKFQLCIQNESGTFEAHSPIFGGTIQGSLDHDAEEIDIDTSELFDAYREYINQLILDSGARVVDTELDEDSDHLVENRAVAGAIAGLNERLGDLSNLNTTDKTDLVSAINEAASTGGGGGQPIPATLASQMDAEQEDALYLYLGNEEGYEYGYIYAYQNGAFAPTTLYGRGQNGADGADGEDGYSPTASVTQTATGATITVTDKNGTTTAQVENGTATDAQVAAWLDEHPEATTTVEDGAVTIAKLADDVIERLVQTDKDVTRVKSVILHEHESFVSASDYTSANNTSINASTGGTNTYSTGWKCTGYIDVSQYTLLYATMPTFTASNTGGMAFYDADKHYISGVAGRATGVGGRENVFIEVPQSAVYARFSNRVADLDNCIVYDGNLYKADLEITDAVEGFKDLFSWNLVTDQLPETGYTEATGGVVATTQDYKNTGYVSVLGGTKIKFMAPVLNSNRTGAGVAFYDSDKQYISGLLYDVDASSQNAVKEMETDIPEDAAYVRTCYRATQTSGFYLYIYSVYDSKAKDEVLHDEIEAVKSTPTPVIFDIDSPVQPGGTGISNKVTVEPVINADDINIAVRISLSSENTVVFLGSLDLKGDSHASHVQYDFGAKQIRIYQKGTGTAVPSTVLFTESFESIFNGMEYVLQIGRKHRDLYVGIVNITTGEDISYTVLETVTGGYAYPCGWLNDQLTYGVISGNVTFKRVTAVTKASPLCAFIGNSITEGYGVPYADSWAYKVSELWGNCLCMGRSGATIDISILQVKDIASKIRPKYIVVEIGTNGGNNSNNLSELVNAIKAVGSVPVLCHIPMMGNKQNISINNTIDTLNTLTVHFDTATAVDNTPASGQNTSLFQSDRIHPNTYGMNKMYQQFIAELGWIKVN